MGAPENVFFFLEPGTCQPIKALPVSQFSTAVDYNFQGGGKGGHSSESAKGTAFNKVHSENNINICFINIQDTLSQVLNAPSHATNTKSQCKRHQVRQPKQQVRQPKQRVRPILIDAVLSRCNLRTFLAYNLQAKNAVAYKE